MLLCARIDAERCAVNSYDSITVRVSKWHSGILQTSLASFIALLYSFLVRYQVNIAGVPDGNRLDEYALLRRALDVADHIQPCTNIHLMLLNPLEHVMNVDICDRRRTRNRIVVLEAQSRRLHNVLIDTWPRSVSANATA